MSYVIVRSWSKTNSHEQYNSVEGTTKYSTKSEAKEAINKIYSNAIKDELATGVSWFREHDGFMYIQQIRTATGYSVSWVTCEIKYLIK